MVASRVRQLLESRVPSEEILILFRKWSDQADFVVDVMRQWGLNAWTDQPGSLQTEPTVSALRTAARLPLQEWETEQIVRLLRNGQLRPAWPECDRMALASAAWVIQSTSVFRGRQQLLRELERGTQEQPHPRITPERVASARELVNRLFDLLGPMDQPRTWSGQMDQLRQVVRGLGLDAASADSLDTLLDWLDDHDLVLERLGRGNEPLSWRDFVAEMEAIVAEIAVEPAASPWGSIRVTTVENAAGARAGHVILAGLEEGSFPDRAAIEPFLALRAGEAPDPRCRGAYGQEMCRFLCVVGSAQRSLTLVYPTTDIKGQELLRAGFLDQFLGRLTPEAVAACHAAYSRFHPALIEPAETVGTSGDLRVRAGGSGQRAGGPARTWPTGPESIASASPRRHGCRGACAPASAAGNALQRVRGRTQRSGSGRRGQVDARRCLLLQPESDRNVHSLSLSILQQGCVEAQAAGGKRRA